MLQPFQQLYDNPEDVPMIPLDVAEYIQARLNAGYLMQVGTTKWLMAQGYSESYIAGFLAGCQYGVQLVDDAENIRKQLQEDGVR